MPAPIAAPPSTDRGRLEEAVHRVRDHAIAWARATIPERIRMAAAMRDGAVRVSERLVAAACAAKGLTPGTPQEGEEWLASPFVIVRTFRQLIESLRAIERTGTTPIGPVTRTSDGRRLVQTFPASRIDALLFSGGRADVLLQESADRGEDAPRASFYRQRDHDGKLCLVLGAGNVNSIPAADVATKMFNEGKVCLLKMNPVNAYVGPLLEEAFAEPIGRGFLAIVYGGAEEGTFLTRHAAVDEIHMTGSDQTHDAIVWGPPGPERAERMARNQPLVAKEITSELGNVTPILVVPGPWTDRELAFQAENVAGMVTHNASFNCIAGKMLILPRGWALRDRFLGLLRTALGSTPARRAWYPGAEERYRKLTGNRGSVERIGATEGTLPWTLVLDLDPADAGEVAYRMEPFCSILSEVAVGGADPAEYLAAAVRFSNERLRGTLAAAVVVGRAAEREPATHAALERAFRDLRYGTVAVNVWPGLAFALGTLPWGAYPGAPLTDIQSGRGFVHNTRMLDGIEKTIVRAPSWSPVKLPYFPSHRSAHVLGPRLTRLEETGGWSRLPPVLAAALRG